MKMYNYQIKETTADFDVIGTPHGEYRIYKGKSMYGRDITSFLKKVIYVSGTDTCLGIYDTDEEVFNSIYDYEKEKFSL